MEEVMLDNREVFACGFHLEFREDCSYIITEEIGRGKSCLVYGAYYEDAAGCSHQVRIKECYPYGLEIHRKEDGTLEVSKESEALFEKAKERFYKSYQDNVNLKNISGLTNSTVNAVNFLRKNNTCYSVVECVEGSDYRAEVDADLPSLLIRIRTLARIIKKYHDRNLLHLDIKPENILVLPETSEHMLLFDFDSVFAVEDLKKEGEELLSLSEGFAAPELLLGKWEKVCAATDIYSIGAVLFYKLFDRKPNVIDMAAGSKFDFEHIKYADKKCTPEFYKKLERFLHKTISSSVSYRFRKIDEVLEMLGELITLSTTDEKPKRKKALWILAGILIAALIVVWAAWYFIKVGQSNMYLAEKALQEGKDREALAYYQAALEKEPNLEAYSKSVMILRRNQEYGDATAYLKEAISKTAEISEGNTWKNLLEEVYTEAADYYFSQKDYAQAHTLLKEGIGYFSQIDAVMKEEAGYSSEEDIFEEQDTVPARTARLEEKDKELYIRESDSYLLEGKYLDAVQVLVDGRRENGYGDLLEREKYLREHIQVTKKTTYLGSRYRDDFEEPFESGNYHINIEEYFENGNLKRILYYSNSGDVVGRDEREPDGGIDVHYDDWIMDEWTEITYEYDEEGRISAKYEDSYKADGTWFYFSIEALYQYDEAGRVLSYGAGFGYMSGRDIIYSAHQNKYDETGKLVESEIVEANEDQEIEWHAVWKYEYDEKGNRLKDTWYDSDGNVLDEVQYQYRYDEDGYLVWSFNAGFGKTMEYYAFESKYNILELEVESIETLDEHYYTYEYSFTGELPQLEK